MAMLMGSNFVAVAPPSQLRHSSGHCVFRRHTTTFKRRLLSTKVAASSTAFVESNPAGPIAVDESNINKNILACPICYNQLAFIGNHEISINSFADSNLQCNTCKKNYYGNKTHLELTAASGSKEYSESLAPATEFFRLPLISYIYERGWRQGFSMFQGFPGPEEEFEMIKGYIEPVLGGNIVDASCGSGMFTRLFAKSGLFSQVIALDYSEEMLNQSHDFIEKEESFPRENLVLVRADISRLPFVSSSIDALHAGAALHCWPSPSTAVAEISRVLRPGGVFVATTFILDGPYSLIPFLKPLSQNMMQISGSHIFLSEGELEDLCKACGLIDFKCVRNRRFVMISATKPN